MFLPPSVVTALEAYQARYRNPALAPFDVSELYALTVEAAARAPTGWPATWPNSERAGVYLIFDHGLDLLYVGRADVIGVRLAAYFGYEDGRGSACKWDRTAWDDEQLAFVATVGVTYRFEASSLEEFLIERLQPRMNKRLRMVDSSAT